MKNGCVARTHEGLVGVRLDRAKPCREPTVHAIPLRNDMRHSVAQRYVVGLSASGLSDFVRHSRTADAVFDVQVEYVRPKGRKTFCRIITWAPKGG